MPDLVHYDGEEAVFRKSAAERLWWGALFVFIDSLLCFLTVDTFKGGAAERDHVPLDFVMLFVITVILGFAAGKTEMRFGFRRRRYQSKQGFLFLSWTRSGDVSEISHIGVWNTLKFTGLTVEWKNTRRLQTTFTRCETGKETQALAERLGISLGVPVKAGIPRGVKKAR